jgi:hypothetical protein
MQHLLFPQIWQTLDGKREVVTEMKKIKVRQFHRKPVDLSLGEFIDPRPYLSTCSKMQQFHGHSGQVLV